MGLELNSITIKTPGDLQEALLVDTEYQDFVWQFKAMVDRWGLESASTMLGIALYGDKEHNIEPLIKVTHKLWTNPNDYGEYYLVPII